MKISNQNERKAISPIIATVLIIAATLIAAAAIGGYVFGIFGSSTSTANVQVTSSLLAGGGGGSGTTSTLVSACATSATAPDIALYNSGTGSATVTGLSMTFGGKSYTSTPGGTLCNMAGASTIYLNFSVGGTNTPLGTSGTAFNGFVILSNGAQVAFTGTFQ